MNNLIKGWKSTTSEWVAFIDSNVLLPTDAISRLLDCWDDRCGMVCSPPIGASCGNFAADVEATFLNGYQARWQLSAATAGLGFAQGKVMFFRRSLLLRSGGLISLASEPAEDAAATKVVRANGLSINLLRQPFDQPLGRRKFVEVWNRQLRWAQLRRATFPLFFYLEIGTSGVLPAIWLVLEEGVTPAAAYLAAWYAIEISFVIRSGWGVSLRTLPATLVRDLMVLPIWLTAIWRNKFEWQGHAMSVNDVGAAT